jgi:hypothetical protein
MNVLILNTGRKIRTDLGTFLVQARRHEGLPPSDDVAALLTRLSHALTSTVSAKKLNMQIQLKQGEVWTVAAMRELGCKLSEAGYHIGIFENIAVVSLNTDSADGRIENSDGFQLVNLDTAETIVTDGDALSTFRTIGNVKLVESTLFADLNRCLAQVLQAFVPDDSGQVLPMN